MFLARRIEQLAHTSIIMAAFTHLNQEGCRFSDGTYGVFYAARDLEAAIAETKHHRARFMRATMQARMEIDMRVYLVDLAGELHDLREQQEAYPRVYHKDDYAPASSSRFESPRPKAASQH